MHTKTWIAFMAFCLTLSLASHGLAQPRGMLIQRGTKLALLGVTDDDHAIYQEGPNLYATALVPGARRTQIASIGDQLPFVQIAGDVAFIWTDRPKHQLAGKSPLWVWTARGGMRLASNASVVATYGAAASPDNRQIMFITNVDAEGATGDLVSGTPALRELRLLASHVNVDYTHGSCVPFLGFAGRAPHSFPVATYCDASEPTARLATYRPGASMSIGNIAPFARWTAAPSGKLFVTSQADSQFAIAVDARGNVQVLDPTPNIGVFMNSDGAVIEAAAISGSERGELRRIEVGGRLDPHASPSVRTLSELGGTYYASLVNGSGYYLASPTSKNGQQLLYYDRVDPQTGLTDLHFMDVSHAPAEPATLVAEPIATVFGELFTADSSHALYYIVDPATGNLAFYAASRADDARQLSDGFSAWNNFAATGSRVTYLDHAHIDPDDSSPNSFPGLGSVTADLHVVDVSEAELQPQLIAEQAYSGYFPARHRHSVAYSWDRDPEHAGIYLACLP